ncbi:MAG: fumarylacetoacetate hydrolase family protein, partial [Candidatus Acidiferrales bacterium]
MKLVRFNGGRSGVLKDARVHDITAAIGLNPAAWPPVGMVQLIANFDSLLPRILPEINRGGGIPENETRLETPILWPNKLIAYPVNFTAHGEERNVTLRADTNGFFLKAG